MRGMLAAIAVAFSLLMLYGCTGCNLFNPEENGHQNGSIHPFNPEETGYQNGSLHGKLTDSESAPLSDVTISFKGAKSSFSVSAGDSGSYDITDIPPDTYSVEYSKDGYYIYGYSGFTVADGQAYQKDVVLKGLNQYGELHGTVYDSKGTPLANVTVLFVGKKSNFSTVISQNGSYSVKNIPPDTYYVKYSKEGFYPYDYSNLTVVGGVTYTGKVLLTAIYKPCSDGLKLCGKDCVSESLCCAFTDCPYGQACKDNKCITPTKVHEYDNAGIDERKVMVYAFYLVPKDRQPRSDWKEKITYLINSSVEAYNRDLNGVSVASYEVYPTPVIGEKTIEGYRFQVNDSNRTAYYWPMCLQGEALRPESLSIYTVYAIFPDWGMLDRDNYTYTTSCDKLTRCAEGVDLSDRDMCGGSVGAAWGSYRGRGNFGCGVISLEAWLHPEILGATTVTAHEALGHGIGLWHEDDVLGKNSDTGIMGLGYYYCYNTTNSHFEPKLLERMID